MTVAAVVLAASSESALADVAGQARVRRIADIAWSGGALPIVVVAPDPDGAVAAALAGASAILGSPAPAAVGPVGQMVHGIELAAAEVSDLTAAIIWPARYAWVGPETVTSLIEAHGPAAGTVLRPAYRGEAGWPCLVPLAQAERLRAIGRDRMPDEILADLLGGEAVPSRILELGDPGTVHDATTPREDLPAYDGPSEPASGHAHEWGATAADLPELQDEPAR